MDHNLASMLLEIRYALVCGYPQLLSHHPDAGLAVIYQVLVWSTYQTASRGLVTKLVNAIVSCFTSSCSDEPQESRPISFSVFVRRLYALRYLLSDDSMLCAAWRVSSSQLYQHRRALLMVLFKAMIAITNKSGSKEHLPACTQLLRELQHDVDPFISDQAKITLLKHFQ
eukprot:TRINITY_DN2883_c0_g1_i11.p1 TRINITY_DN2883_c0_g1~~TRINITY_DN2883_c0_g1_i11.p1  ORF type:complete len:170 (-),score=40.12 TRINITY_DN2883_c0_g1_i11:204-713(-)